VTGEEQSKEEQALMGDVGLPVPSFSEGAQPLLGLCPDTVGTGARLAASLTVSSGRS